MPRLMYAQISEMSDDDFWTRLNDIPDFMRGDIMRYKQSNDRKSRLIARLMLRHAMEAGDNLGMLYRWKRDNNNKPFVEGWHQFSISHSADRVVLVWDERGPIGVDVEYAKDINCMEMIECFLPDEQKFILSSKNLQQAFYTLWVKKEAALKRLGHGIVKGLKLFSCLEEIATYNGSSLYFYEFPLSKDYACYICSSMATDRIDVQHFLLKGD